MNLKDYLTKRGKMPKSAATEWLSLCTLDVTTGALWAGDPHLANADDGHVTTLAVDPVWHRHRIGTRLLHTLATGAIERGARNLTLEVRVTNEPAQALYRAFGFAPAGVRKGYYVESGEDALIMWANDVDTEEYRARLDRLAAALPAPTVLEELDR